MRLEGVEIIKTSRDKVWQFVTDPHVISQCAPGARSLEVLAPNERFRVVADVHLGTIAVTFTVTVTYALLGEPELANFRATATAAGSEARVTSFLVLTETAQGWTEMKWTVDLTVFGSIAGLAERLIPPVSKQLVDEFFKCVKKTLEV